MKLELWNMGQIMLDRDTGRPRGFGFVTFADRRAMQDAIAEFHGMELNGRTISVNKAQPRASDDGYGYGGFSSGGRGGHISDDGPIGKSDCFKCGRPGHWARDCPSTGDGGRVGGRFPPPPRYPGGRGDRARGSYSDRYADDRYDGSRYGERDRVVSRDSRYGGRDRYGGDRSPAGRDRVGSDRYGSPAGRDRVGSDRYGSSDRYPQNGHVKERGGYDRDGGRGSDRYGSGGPTRYESGSDRYGSGGPTRYEGGSYRDRAAPYDRPGKGRPSSHDDRY